MEGRAARALPALGLAFVCCWFLSFVWLLAASIPLNGPNPPPKPPIPSCAWAGLAHEALKITTATSMKNRFMSRSNLIMGKENHAAENLKTLWLAWVLAPVASLHSPAGLFDVQGFAGDEAFRSCWLAGQRFLF